MNQDAWQSSRIEALEKAAEEIQREKEALENRIADLENVLVQIGLRTDSPWIEQVCERTLGKKIMTELEKLLKLADWFDMFDAKRGVTDAAVQDDLRRIAKRLAELESAICETCKDPRCEDSRLAYYVTKAMKAGERIGRLEKALKEIREHKCGNCGAQNMADDALECK
jgi:chromosome segregation ATPase